MITFIQHITEQAKDTRRKALFRCFCGNEFKAVYRRVLGGYVKSCGCLIHSGDWQRKHGHRSNQNHSTREYRSWQAMKRRCEVPEDKDYPRYGAKGIRVCERWLNSFENFFADMGPRPENHTIDRINGTKGYSPENCRWATLTQQVENTRTFVWLITPKGRMALRDWALHLGISRGAAHQRLKRGKLEGCLKA